MNAAAICIKSRHSYHFHCWHPPPPPPPSLLICCLSFSSCRVRVYSSRYGPGYWECCVTCVGFPHQLLGGKLHKGVRMPSLRLQWIHWMCPTYWNNSIGIKGYVFLTIWGMSTIFIYIFFMIWFNHGKVIRWWHLIIILIANKLR